MEQTTREIDVRALFALLFKRKWLIIGFVALGLLLACGKIAFLTRDAYTSDGSLYVNCATDTVEKTTKSDLDSSRSLTTTYIQILGSRTFLSDVAARVGTGRTYGDLRRMISYAAVNDTELISVTVTAPDAEEAHDIVAAVLELAPDKLAGVITGEVVTIDEPLIPEGPDGKGVVKNLSLGAVIGLVCGCAVIVFLYLFDKKIHTAEELTKRYSASLLGELSQ